MDGLNAAALCRFDFKLHFRPRRPALARKPQRLEHLAPGDFANLVRQRNKDMVKRHPLTHIHVEILPTP